MTKSTMHALLLLATGNVVLAAQQQEVGVSPAFANGHVVWNLKCVHFWKSSANDFRHADVPGRVSLASSHVERRSLQRRGGGGPGQDSSTDLQQAGQTQASGSGSGKADTESKSTTKGLRKGLFDKSPKVASQQKALIDKSSEAASEQEALTGPHEDHKLDAETAYDKHKKVMAAMRYYLRPQELARFQKSPATYASVPSSKYWHAVNVGEVKYHKHEADPNGRTKRIVFPDLSSCYSVALCGKSGTVAAHLRSRDHSSGVGQKLPVDQVWDHWNGIVSKVKQHQSDLGPKPRFVGVSHNEIYSQHLVNGIKTILGSKNLRFRDESTHIYSREHPDQLGKTRHNVFVDPSPENPQPVEDHKSWKAD